MAAKHLNQNPLETFGIVKNPLDKRTWLVVSLVTQGSDVVAAKISDPLSYHPAIDYLNSLIAKKYNTNKEL